MLSVVLIRVCKCSHEIVLKNCLKSFDTIEYIVEASNDLIQWDELSTEIGAPMDNEDGTETVTIRDTDPIDANTARYIRVRVKTPEEVPAGLQVNGKR